MADGTLADYISIAPSSTGWGVTQNALAQALPLLTQTGSPNRQFGTALGVSLLSALLGYQARRSAADQSLQAAQLGSQMLGMATPEERLNLIKGVDSTNIQQNLLGLNARIGEQELVSKLSRQQKLNDLATMAQFELSPLAQQVADQKLQREIQLETAKRSALIRSLGGVGARSDVSAAQPTYLALPEPTPGQPESLDLKVRRKASELLTQFPGLTPNAAMQRAEKEVKFQYAQLKDVQDTINKAREQSQIAANTAAIAKQAIEGAGETGGPLGGVREIASQLYATLPGAGPAQEREQRAAQALFSQVKANMVNLNKFPGAISNDEMRLLARTGPTEELIPAQNRELQASIQRVADLNDEYASFLEQYVQTKGTAEGAQKQWDVYKRLEVFKNGMYNPKRMSIFDFLNKAQQVLEQRRN